MESSRSGLSQNVVRFARTLRAHGVSVGIGDELDSAWALTLVDLFDRDEVHRTLRTAFKVRPRDRDEFDRVFAEVWSGRHAMTRRSGAERRPALPGPARADLLARSYQLAAEPAAGADADNDRPGYSPALLLRRKPFDECSFEDLQAMSRLIERLARRLATRRSRRLRPARGRGVVDARRSLRSAVGTAGELVRLARRERAIDVPHLVVLCDTSGSMDAHVRFLLTFLVAVKRHVPRTEVFAFNTSLVRITPWLMPGKIEQTLERLAATVPDWSGGTRIGESLSDFVANHSQLVRSTTTVLIFSDGLDRGDTALVAEAMRAIRARARKVLWLNPLGGDPRYEPTARAMQAAMPFIDRLAPAHNLASVERLLADLVR